MESYSCDCVLYPEISKKASRSNHQKPASRSRRHLVRSDCDVRQVPIVDFASLTRSLVDPRDQRLAATASARVLFSANNGR
jgi:hypothetical protein